MPHPGTLVLDARGTVTGRSFERAYQERASAASLLARAMPASEGRVQTETAHVVVTTSASDARVAPGTRLALVVDIAPKAKMHVYAPEQKELIPVSVRLDPGEFTAHAPLFPAAERYLFKPLNETQLVYSRPFRIVQDITVPLTPAIRERARSGGTIAVTGTLRYQACDDAVCYTPVTVPLTWTVGLKGMER